MRGLHLALASAVLLAWCSGHLADRLPAGAFGFVHHGAGYVVLAAVACRIVWGFAGDPRARFADFVRGPRTTWRHAVAMLRGRALRYLGHNPLGGWMVLALLATAGAAGVTGWLMTTDAYWGVESMQRLHATLAWALAVLVPLHVAGVVVTGWLHRENLVAAMVHGRKRLVDDPGPAPTTAGRGSRH